MEGAHLDPVGRCIWYVLKIYAYDCLMGEDIRISLMGVGGKVHAAGIPLAVYYLTFQVALFRAGRSGLGGGSRESH